MIASLSQLYGDPMLAIAALLSLALMALLAGDGVREMLDRRRLRRQRARVRRDL